jgi:SAM-dependent methyltransferase
MNPPTAIPDHDLPLGHLDRCQTCGAAELETVLDLGYQPPCDSLLTAAQLKSPETFYPLRFVRCGACGLAQIDHVVPREVLFHTEYPYRSGITPTLVRNLQGTASTIVDAFRLAPNSLCIDIGSNDGTLLKGFQQKGMRVLGIEATNIAQIARADGVDTIQAFFGEALANRIVASHGNAAAITATNVFAHVQNLGDLMRGVSRLLRPGGVFVTESHYLLDLLATRQYDSIYHEHLRYYGLKPLLHLHEYYGFTVVDAERIPNYGGSIRVYAINRSGERGSARLAELIAEEDRAGIYAPAVYAELPATVRRARLELQGMLVDLAAKGSPAPGIGCPGRSSTLLNYCNIDPELMPYIAEQSTSLKLGLFLPGKHIPIVDEKRLFDEQPEYAVMLSWHYAEPIIRGLRARGLKSKIILPLPEVRVVEG